MVELFQDAILGLLGFFHRLTNNFGFDILLLTLFFKAATYPLQRKSMLAMKKMATISPLMQELQKRYKDEPQKLQQEMGKLYKEKGINPVAGCLPMLLQLPLFFLLYSVLRDPTVNNYLFTNASFFGMDLTTNPVTALTYDFYHNMALALPGTIVLNIQTLLWSPEAPYVGVLYLPAVGLLAFMLTTQFISTWFTATGDKNQRMQMMLFNVMFIWFGLSMPSGVLLYWTTQNLIGMLQQFLINKEHARSEGTVKVKPGKA